MTMEHDAMQNFHRLWIQCDTAKNKRTINMTLELIDALEGIVEKIGWDEVRSAAAEAKTPSSTIPVKPTAWFDAVNLLTACGEKGGNIPDEELLRDIQSAVENGTWKDVVAVLKKVFCGGKF